MTELFIAVISIAIIVFDFFIIGKKGKYFSISAYIIRWSRLYPMIPFLLGIICGHLFWSMQTKDWQELPQKPKEEIEASRN